MDIAEKTLQLKQDFDDVYEAGKNKAIKEWQDDYLTYKNAVGYHFAFSAWNEETYRLFLSQPNDKLFKIINGADQMYRNFNMYGVNRQTIDLVELHKELGIPDIDWSTATQSCYNTFSYSRISRLGIMDLSNTTHSRFFTNASYLVTIDELKLNPSSEYTSLFDGCTSLKNIKFGNTIPKSLSFAVSPLTKESIEDVVEHLSDDVTGQTITFKKTAKESDFTTEEWAALIATKPNWSFSLI